jgi:mRNA interferase MazF
MVTRGDVWLAVLDPAVGGEIRKTRPCLVVSPPELHDHLRTIIVAPMTTGNRAAPYRVPIAFEGTRGLVLLDQLRALDKTRLLKRLGNASPRTLAASLRVLQEIFAE